MLTDAQSFPLPVPSPGYHISGKGVEVRDSGSRHHQLCGCCNLQLIQSHVAPSHGPPARVLSPLSSWQSLSCCLSHVAKRSTPKPRGPLPFPSELHGPLLTSPKLPDPRPSPPKLVVLSFPSSEPRGPLSIYLLQNLVVPPFTSEPCGPVFTSEPHCLLSSPPKPYGPPPSLWLPRLGLNPSAHLPLQPHFRLLLQSVTPASIPVFFQLF